MLFVLLLAGFVVVHVLRGRKMVVVGHLMFGASLGAIAFWSSIFGLTSSTLFFVALIVLAAAHLYGVGEALYWTLASIAALGIVAFAIDSVTRPDGSVSNELDFFVTRSVFVAAVFGFAAATRVSADRRARELEDARRKATEAAAAKSDFIASVSHEIRTPLTSIRAALATILRGATGETNETTMEVAQVAQKNSHRLTWLVEDILDYSKIEAGQFDIKPEPYQPENLVTHVRDQILDAAVSKGLQVRCRVDDPALLG